MRQAYDYWQDQPGNRPTFPPPRFVPARPLTGQGTLHRAHRIRLWSRRRPSGFIPGGDCLTGLQTSIPRSRLDAAADFSLERNTQERHARRTSCGEGLPFSASNARIQRTVTFSQRSHRQPTRFFRRSLPPAGDGASVRPAVSTRTDALPRPTTREDRHRGSPRQPGRSVQFSARPPRDHGRAHVAHFLGKSSEASNTLPGKLFRGNRHIAWETVPRQPTHCLGKLFRGNRHICLGNCSEASNSDRSDTASELLPRQPSRSVTTTRYN